MAEAGLDSTKVDAFGDRLLGILNDATLALMISVGHRTGLFDVLGKLPPASCEDIAKTAGLAERYVREWLGAMVTGSVVTYDADSKTYALPAEHAALLTREAAPDNFAVFAQYVSVLGGVEDQIVECFQNGGGVPYSAFPRFHKVMAEESYQTVVSSLEAHILPIAEGLVKQLETGIDVLDIGCGSGRALHRLAKSFPSSRFSGYDLSPDAVEKAEADARQDGLTNLRFEQKDLTQWNETENYDLVTAFDAIHDQAKPSVVLSGIHRVLRPGGTFLMQDIRMSSHLENNLDNPIGPFIYTISCMHCMTVSLAQGGDGLGAAWGEELATQMLKEAGFSTVEVHRLEHDIQNNFYLMKK